jgi:transposase
MMTATRPCESIVSGAVLLMAFELGAQKWLVGFSAGVAQAVRRREIAARDLVRVQREIAAAKVAFGLPAETPVHSCYEAGREGFWLHRWLVHEGVVSRIVDSSSIEVSRRKRRAKSDRLDAAALVRLLARELAGEKQVWSVVRVPSVAAEDRRHLEREIETTVADRTRVRNRIRSLLATQGVALRRWRHLRSQLVVLRTGTGDPLPPMLCARLDRELTWLATTEARLRELRRLQAQAVVPQSVCDRLQQVRGVGIRIAARLSCEVFEWRTFTSGRQVGALVGMTPTPYDSGEQRREQGISKAGNRRVRTMMIELARGWVRFQPDSALARWYTRRFASGSARLRRVGIVALGRKLLIALWRYTTNGVLPEGAQLKPTA